MSIAAAGTTMTTSWPRRRLVLAILAVSLVLNLLFIAGAVWTRVQAPNQRGLEQGFRGIVGDLDLNAEQRAGFERFLAGMRARGANMQQVTPLYGAAWEAAAKPNADPAQVLRLFDQAAEKRRQVAHEALAQTLDFLATLSPEQRSKFIALVRERRGPRRGFSARGG